MGNSGRELRDWDRVAERARIALPLPSVRPLLVPSGDMSQNFKPLKGGLDTCRQRQGCGECQKKFQADLYWGNRGRGGGI